jgi:hypothetical protein
VTDDTKIVAALADADVVLEYALARLRVAAGQAAADLFEAANVHVANRGGTDTWTLAALEAVESLADIARRSTLDAWMPSSGTPS